MRGSWRRIAAPIISDIIRTHSDETEKEIRATLRAAYPFGERKRWPYTVWCSEVNIQLRRWRIWKGIWEYADASQLTLFKED